MVQRQSWREFHGCREAVHWERSGVGDCWKIGVNMKRPEGKSNMQTRNNFKKSCRNLQSCLALEASPQLSGYR